MRGEISHYMNVMRVKELIKMMRRFFHLINYGLKLMNRIMRSVMLGGSV